jgi:hypothetical protein
MGLKKGQTNNPGGRPAKGRAVAERLSKSLARSVVGPDGKKHSGFIILADVVINALLQRMVILPNGKEFELEPKEWIELYKFVVLHIDGPAKSEMDVDANVKTEVVLHVVEEDKPNAM